MIDFERWEVFDTDSLEYHQRKKDLLARYMPYINLMCGGKLQDRFPDMHVIEIHRRDNEDLKLGEITLLLNTGIKYERRKIGAQCVADIDLLNDTAPPGSNSGLQAMFLEMVRKLEDLRGGEHWADWYRLGSQHRPYNEEHLKSKFEWCWQYVGHEAITVGFDKEKAREAFTLGSADTFKERSDPDRSYKPGLSVDGGAMLMWYPPDESASQ